jgi:hypothetical protein
MLELTNPDHQQRLKDLAESLDPIKDRIVSEHNAVIDLDKDGKISTENLSDDVVNEINAMLAAAHQPN